MRSDSELNARSFSRDRDGDADERRQSIGGRRRSRSRSRSPYRRGLKRERRDSYSQNDRMVYISNIPYDVRWMEIKDLVREKAGEVVFVEILEDRFGKSKGAAVVEFRDKDSVQKCIDGLHRHQMKDRLVVAKEIRDPTAFFRKVKEDTGVDFLAPNGRLSRGSTGMGEEEEGCADLRSECRRLAPTTPSVSVLYSFANLASKDRCAIASLSLTYDPFSPVSFQLF
uniref:RRM domain-containing protein n=1 Tax=Plectus sambesii TaxID=2011161 RepID=A0A914UIV7_9BILA